jgi:hypothetical protein
MSDKKQEKLTYAMTEASAIKQISEGNRLKQRAKSLLKTYMCTKKPLKYMDNAIEALAEYVTNTKFYVDVLERHLFTGERIKNEKTGKDNIVVPHDDFALINNYLIITAACENELETLGISMRLH